MHHKTVRAALIFRTVFQMMRFILHTITELAAGQSALGRSQMLESSDGGVLRILNQGLCNGDPVLRVTALQGLHALLSDRFSIEDVLADEVS